MGCRKVKPSCTKCDEARCGYGLSEAVTGLSEAVTFLGSGNAIVSMVLALPTVGPLMLNALFVQDTYLAGSMLMILSVLGVLGTLVSDLLLLWIDPRIRFGGGTR